MNKYSGVILVTAYNSILLQQRDVNNSIVNSGQVAFFGGLNEGKETEIQGAIRELHEETNLKVTEKDLVLYGTFYKTEPDGSETEISLFLLPNVKREGLEIYEGKGYIEIDSQTDLNSVNLTATARTIVTKYLEENMID